MQIQRGLMLALIVLLAAGAPSDAPVVPGAGGLDLTEARACFSERLPFFERSGENAEAVATAVLAACRPKIDAAVGAFVMASNGRYDFKAVLKDERDRLWDIAVENVVEIRAERSAQKTSSVAGRH